MADNARAVVVKVARSILADLPALTTEMTDGFVAVIPEFRHDEVVRRLMVASTSSNLTAIVDMLCHGIPIDQVTVPPAAAEYARRFAQQDLSLEALLRAYRLGEHRFVSWAIDALTRQREEVGTAVALAAIADLSERTNRYIDHVIEGLIAIYETERREWDSRAGAARAAQLRTLLETEAISQDAAQALVEVPLTDHHRAAIAWLPATTHDTTALRTMTHVLAEVSRRRPLTMLADDRTMWAWVSGSTPPLKDLDEFATKLQGIPEVRVCLGGLGRGLDGFRGSLREAQRTRAVVGGMDDPPQLTLFDDVAVVALLTGDIPDVHRWVERTIPGLTGTAPAVVQLRETVSVFLETNGSYTRAASRLHLHKNTVHYRVRKAEELIGRPLLDNRLAVEVALLAAEQVRNRSR